MRHPLYNTGTSTGAASHGADMGIGRIIGLVIGRVGGGDGGASAGAIGTEAACAPVVIASAYGFAAGKADAPPPRNMVRQTIVFPSSASQGRLAVLAAALFCDLDD
ncbi:MAG TPA: hypothetical protein VNS34_26935 [Rhizobiaceae bacterium]|nr:hypothetical protein [Rhizobiaceae bacterium]